MRVLVVGGEPRFIAGTFSSNLAKLGLEMDWHWPWKRGSVSSKTLKPLPDGVELVIVVSDMVRRALRQHAEGAAAHAGVPFINVPRKFAIAHQKLESAGFTQPTPTPTPPTKDVAPMNATPTALPEGVNVKTHEYEFLTMAKAAIEDEPEATDDQILATLASVFESKVPEGAAELVSQAREEITAMWHKPYNKKTPEEHAALVKSRTSWLRRQMQRGFQAEGIEGIPSQTTLRSQMRKLFGTACNTDVLSALRQEVISAGDVDELGADPETPWYEEKGVYRREGVEAEVEAGLAFYEALHNSTVAKLSLWALQNQSGKPTPPSPTLRRYLTPLQGSQLRFGTVMRMAVPTVINAHAGRCYTGLTGSGFGAYVMRTVDTELARRGIVPEPLPEESEAVEPEEPKAVEPEESEAVEPDLHPCPNCERVCEADEIEEVFGYRNMGNGKVLRQSYCRECRGKSAAKPTETTEPTELDILDEIKEQDRRITGDTDLTAYINEFRKERGLWPTMKDVLDSRKAEAHETPERPVTTRMHQDDRAMLVADLRAALNADRSALVRAAQEAAADAKATREAAEAQARDMAALVEGLDTLAVGLGKLSDAVVAIKQQTEGRQTVALDAESVALIRGLETRIVEAATEAIKHIKVKLPEAPAPTGFSEKDTLRRLIDEGRGFKLEVASTAPESE